MGLVAVLTAIAVPQSLATADRLRAGAAARYIAARMALARAHAVKRAAYVALRFDEGPSGTSFRMFVDGNRNGVRTRDIAAGLDPPLEPAVTLTDLFPGIVIGLSEQSGLTDPASSSTRLMSFSPLGSASSGTVYVHGRDDSRLAVRILGVTGRARVLRYDPRARQWVDV